MAAREIKLTRNWWQLTSGATTEIMDMPRDTAQPHLRLHTIQFPVTTEPGSRSGV